MAAVVIIEGFPGGHFPAVGLGVVVVAIEKGPVGGVGESVAESGFPGGGDAHEDEDVWNDAVGAILRRKSRRVQSFVLS